MQLSQLTTTTNSEDDVFAKVKGLIRSMLDDLAEEAEADAKEHEWCTTQTKETTAKKEDHQATADKIQSKIDRSESAITTGTQNLNELKTEVGSLNKMQAEMDQQRGEEHAEYLQAAKDFKAGVEGVQMAIKVLKDYYGKNNAFLQGTSGAGAHDGNGIIGLLEVAESDFSKLLAEIEADEKSAEDEYVKQTKANKVARKQKETSIKYTKKEISRTETSLSEQRDDMDAEQGELDGVLEYLAKVNKRCIAKPETYEQRVAKRQAEIDGLRNALKILQDETAGSDSFLAVRATRHHA
jgi:septal ring factor EnvC (AmiA/AmiB activator)